MNLVGFDGGLSFLFFLQLNTFILIFLQSNLMTHVANVAVC